MVQVIKYSCCNNIFAACMEPHCYTDKEWLRDLRKYVLKGSKVEMISSHDLQFKSCTCKEDSKQLSLEIKE